MLKFLEESCCCLQIMFCFLNSVEWSCDSSDLRCDLCYTHMFFSVVEYESLSVITAESFHDSISSSDVEFLIDIFSLTEKELLEECEQHNELSICCYQNHLHMLWDVCMLCKLLSIDSLNNTHHIMKHCFNCWRFVYFKIHKKTWFISDDWFVSYTVCFRCYNFQQLCSQKGDDVCQYQDLIMLTCWVTFQLLSWRNVKLSDLIECLFQNEAEYMQWLKHQCHTHGIQTFNVMYIADHVFQSITEWFECWCFTTLVWSWHI